ncbi:hypothetical protein KY311_03925, partial [Candidatus Woesearchaeota archaeon]|nr:hypothetical protein [Candidatus Woesearchaeota archaeon]
MKRDGVIVGVLSIAIIVMALVFAPSEQDITGRPVLDYNQTDLGDAPDQTHSFGPPPTMHVKTGGTIPADYPTVHTPIYGAPYGPCHTSYYAMLG